MFDEVTGFAPVADASEAAIRSRAIVFVGKYGARIARAARQIDGEDGAALAAAFEDMVRDDSVGVAGWPICELIEVLQRDTNRAEDVARIVRDARSIARAIDMHILLAFGPA